MLSMYDGQGVNLTEENIRMWNARVDTHGARICKQCNRKHSENLASVFPLISLPDHAQIVQAWHQSELLSLWYNSILANCE